MSYRALYRVFRPGRFADLVGQDVIARTLLNALREQRISHAYLFCGPRGTGKTSTAKILGKAVNCLDLQDGEPCNQCANCQAVNDDRFLDIIEIDAASNRGIDDMRELKDKVRFAPSLGKRKVYIIDEVHMLTTEAFNALLKTLEEPPSHVLFVLATTDPQKIPATILSRTQRFDFHRISNEHIASHLRNIAVEEHIAITDDAIALIAQNAAGGMRDAISLLDQAGAYAEGEVQRADIALLLGHPDEALLMQLMDAVIGHDFQNLFTRMQQLLATCGDGKAVLNALTDHLRDLFKYKVGLHHVIDGLSAQGKTAVQAQSSALSLPQLEQLMTRAAEAERSLRTAPDTALILEITLIDMTLQLQTAVPTVTTTPVAAASIPEKSAPAAPKKPKRTLIAPSDLKQAWPDIMQALKAESVKLHAFLKPAYPLGLEDNTLVIRFPADATFHYEQVRQPDNTKTIRALINQFSSTPMQLQFLMESPAEEEEFDIEVSDTPLITPDAIQIIDEDDGFPD